MPIEETPPDALAAQARIFLDGLDREDPAFRGFGIVGIDDILIGLLVSLLSEGLVRLLRGWFSRWFSRVRERTFAVVRDELARTGRYRSGDVDPLADQLTRRAGSWARGMSRSEYRNMVEATRVRGLPVHATETGED